jgi:hypothetical protein
LIAAVASKQSAPGESNSTCSNSRWQIKLVRSTRKRRYRDDEDLRTSQASRKRLRRRAQAIFSRF